VNSGGPPVTRRQNSGGLREPACANFSQNAQHSAVHALFLLLFFPPLLAAGVGASVHQIGHDASC
jgi:hypothetical protein